MLRILLLLLLPLLLLLIIIIKIIITILTIIERRTVMLVHCQVPFAGHGIDAMHAEAASDHLRRAHVEFGVT